MGNGHATNHEMRFTDGAGKEYSVRTRMDFRKGQDMWADARQGNNAWKKIRRVDLSIDKQGQVSMRDDTGNHVSFAGDAAKFLLQVRLLMKDNTRKGGGPNECQWNEPKDFGEFYPWGQGKRPICAKTGEPLHGTFLCTRALAEHGWIVVKNLEVKWNPDGSKLTQHKQMADALGDNNMMNFIAGSIKKDGTLSFNSQTFNSEMNNFMSHLDATEASARANYGKNDCEDCGLLELKKQSQEEKIKTKTAVASDVGQVVGAAQAGHVVSLDWVVANRGKL